MTNIGRSRPFASAGVFFAIVSFYMGWQERAAGDPPTDWIINFVLCAFLLASAAAHYSKRSSLSDRSDQN